MTKFKQFLTELVNETRKQKLVSPYCVRPPLASVQFSAAASSHWADKTNWQTRRTGRQDELADKTNWQTRRTGRGWEMFCHSWTSICSPHATSRLLWTARNSALHFSVHAILTVIFLFFYLLISVIGWMPWVAQHIVRFRVSLMKSVEEWLYFVMT